MIFSGGLASLRWKFMGEFGGKFIPKYYRKTVVCGSGYMDVYGIYLSRMGVDKMIYIFT